MVTGRGDKGDALPEKEIILCLPSKSQGSLFSAFTREPVIPTKALRRKVGQRQYDNFRRNIPKINAVLQDLGAQPIFITEWSEVNGREQKIIKIRENIEIRYNEATGYAIIRT